MIIAWYGSIASIPSGFVICDGNNNTPDLRDKFIIGAGNNYAVDDTGGSKDATLVTHTHNLDTLNEFSGAYGVWQTGGGLRQDHVGGTHRKPITSEPNQTHSSATDKNLPPYHALCYIMKT